MTDEVVLVRSRDVVIAPSKPRSVRRSATWLAASALWGAAAVALVFRDVPAAYRAPVSIAFVLLCPGLAIVRLVRTDALLTATLGVALSLALDVLVPALLLYSGAWSPDWALVVLVGVTVAAAATETSTAFRARVT